MDLESYIWLILFLLGSGVGLEGWVVMLVIFFFFFFLYSADEEITRYDDEDNYAIAS